MNSKSNASRPRNRRSVFRRLLNYMGNHRLTFLRSAFWLPFPVWPIWLERI
ncbi:hypothetical protein [Allobaculum sp. Allo2]|uniref:hypothetical protein n=1 Tax=Allobaculum sp. Allo2 TaxID=2853432 RepID=UPI001F61B22D|nr:hypothetical protein [Allobaculum sp. Allo2]